MLQNQGLHVASRKHRDRVKIRISIRVRVMVKVKVGVSVKISDATTSGLSLCNTARRSLFAIVVVYTK